MKKKKGRGEDCGHGGEGCRVGMHAINVGGGELSCWDVGMSGRVGNEWLLGVANKRRKERNKQDVFLLW
jgi:hypothetical protein